jgi:hypothetical protein
MVDVDDALIAGSDVILSVVPLPKHRGWPGDLPRNSSVSVIYIYNALLKIRMTRVVFNPFP